MYLVTVFARAQPTARVSCSGPLIRFTALAVVYASALWVTSARTPASTPADQLLSSAKAEARAIAYLAREVPRWRQEHACYSCHNNGDAARALIAGLQRQHAVRAALDDTLTWLADPVRWNSNPGGEGGGDDKRLARIQFASATVAASAASLVTQPAVDAAAALVATDQQEDGSWRLDSSTSLGSPATYGTPLATAFALRVMSQSRAGSGAEPIARGRAWLRRVEPANVPDAVAIILGLGNATGDRDPQRRALDFLERAQGRDGGWGAYRRRRRSRSIRPLRSSLCRRSRVVKITTLACIGTRPARRNRSRP